MIQNGLSKQSSFGFSMHDESDGTFITFYYTKDVICI